MNALLAHWQPTLGAILAAVGQTLQPMGGQIGTIGQFILIAGTLLLGGSAAQASKTVTKP